MKSYLFKISLYVLLVKVALSYETRSEQLRDGVETNSLVSQNLFVSREEHSGESENGSEESRSADMLAMIASLSTDDGDVTPAEYEIREAGGDNLFETRRGKRVPNFDWHLKLDQANRYQLDWRVEYTRNKIVFGLNINTTVSNFRQGYDIFALGFSNYGQLYSSDFCLIWYDLSHKIHLQDARTNSNNQLELIDTSDSVCKLLKASKSGPKRKAARILKSEYGERRITEAENELLNTNDLLSKNNDKFKTLKEGADVQEEELPMSVIFERPLDVCTSKSYYKIDNGTTHVVWFTMRGPSLSIDGLNLTSFVESSLKKNLTNDQFEFGMKRVQLIATKPANIVYSGSKKQTYEIRMDKFQIPAKETTYWCKLFKLNSRFESRKYHITKYEAVIDEGNEHVVHHMELFNCANLNSKQEFDLKDLYENRGGWSGDCNGPTRPKETEPCRRVILAWAMGAHPLEYPDEVGQSIGGHKYSPYVVLEVHYNNVRFTPNLVDNSGLKFHYTSKLRPFDAGILEVGLEYTDKNSIPPNMITPMAGYCVSECTRAAMSGMLDAGDDSNNPDNNNNNNNNYNKHHQQHRQVLAGSNSSFSLTEARPEEEERKRAKNRATQASLKAGIYVFAGQMHTHLAGVASWTEHIREGKILNELQRDNHYSPHFQEIRLLPEPIHVAPGDALIHYCLYDTTKRTNVTLGGFATSDEMCVTYLHYYPRIDLEVCKSSVDSAALEDYFAYLSREEGQNTSFGRFKNSSNLKSFDSVGRAVEKKKKDSKSNNELRAKSISENYNSIEWSKRRSRELIQFYSQAPLSVQCNRSNGDRFPGYWNGIWPTQLWQRGQSASAPFKSGCSTNPEGAARLVGYRGAPQFNRRHAQCYAEE